MPRRNAYMLPKRKMENEKKTGTVARPVYKLQPSR